MIPVSRRQFLAQSATLALGSLAAARLGAAASPAGASAEFHSDWQSCPDRVWPGPEYWTNPLQDWRVADGRLECTNVAGNRNIHVLTREVAGGGNLRMSVRIGRVGARTLAGPGSAGFRIGIQGTLPDYRNRLIYGRGLDAGISGNGTLFIGDAGSGKLAKVDLASESIELRLTAEPSGDAAYALTLIALGENGRELGRVAQPIAAAPLAGNLALASNFAGGEPRGGGAAAKKGKTKQPADAPGGRFWFADWTIAGSGVRAHPERAFGPILFSQYTLSRGVMKLTAQMPPLGDADTPTVRLQIRRGPEWSTIGEERIHPFARTATFRAERWDDRADAPYRLVYALKNRDGSTAEHTWDGVIRRDPADQPVITVADISCNIHEAFPNSEYTARMGRINPDVLAFTGDQFYESSGGYGVTRQPLEVAMNDYLRKWYLHGWTWRELMRDRPSISLPDDHDVYQGNLWGEGGAGQKTTQAGGGYDMAAEWVNIVYRTQTSHHPDPYDPTPAQRGTLQYYGPFVYGRISFAVLADRQYKSGPEGKVPNPNPRADHVVDPNYDPKTADVPGLSLLGEKQEQFLREWVRDWRGADMKAVISQTVFTALPTTHGREPLILRADFDTNGWPQTPRNRAVREIRKAFAFHIAGDQHLPAVLHYGVDTHRDGPAAFAGPAVNTGYPRAFEPAKAPWTKPRQPGLLGDFTDSYGHPMSVLALKNGAGESAGRGNLLRYLDEKASALGVVRFDKPKRQIVVECWPFLPDPAAPDRQLPGWPVTIDMRANYGRKPAAHLPVLQIRGAQDPVVEVLEETSGELVYALRIRGDKFQPHVFATGKYTVRVSDPDRSAAVTLKALEATPENRTIREVKL